MSTIDLPRAVRVIDSHTEGEPTRVVVDGWPEPAGDTPEARREHMRTRQDALRRAIVCEPRGHEAMVGALLVPPIDDGAVTGVVFFNNRGYLGMCGHGLIGVVRTLQYQERLGPGEFRIDTPVGRVQATLATDGSVTMRNVPAYCLAQDLAVEVGGRRISGDVAYGGNWFFLADSPGVPIELSRVDELLSLTRDVHRALFHAGIRGRDGEEIDHIELFGPPRRVDADSVNFVLCPGGEFDRSPCGTGTSAKMSVLHARGKLAPGARWRQEGLCGGQFVGTLEAEEGDLIPTIRGDAFVTGETELQFDPQDPMRGGFGRW